MKYWSRVLLFLSMIGFAISGYAFMGNKSKSIHASLTLDSIQMKRMQEKNGDELYLTVTAYPTKVRPTNIEIPSFPEYWMSKYVNQVKDVPLWDGHIENMDSTTVVVSLVDRDLPPWNIDDVLGTAQVIFKNNNGHLETIWKTPNLNAKMTTIKSEQHRKMFDFKVPDESSYKVSFTAK